MKKLKRGDKLYRYTGVSILSYEVTGVVTRSVGTLYIVMCLDCHDHEQCELLLAESKENHGFKFIDMITSDLQSYWHDDSDRYQRFQLSKDEAVIKRNEAFIDTLEEQNKESASSIEYNEKKIKEAKAIIEALEDTAKKEKKTNSKPERKD
jgi:septal ring factor EnvC (AmiA/AmiB activator)